MSTPYDFCDICDGWGGNGAKCSKCKKDAGSPLRIDPKPELSRYFDMKEFLSIIDLYFMSIESFIDFCSVSSPGCRNGGCDLVKCKDSDNNLEYTWCRICGNGEIINI